MLCLLIEDDFSSAHSTKLALKVKGIECDIAFTGHEGLEKACQNEYDIILLDMILPDIEGMEVIYAIRQNRVSTPIIVLSGMTRVDYKIRALQLGADDYVTKPYDSNELIARIHSVIKRCFKKQRVISNVGNLTIDFESRSVRIAENSMKLTDMEFKLLELLSLKLDEITTKESIMQHLYGSTDAVPNKVINVFVCRLRKKLEKASGGLNFIRTSWGGGYQLLGQGEMSSGSGRQELFTKQPKAAVNQ